MNDHPEECHHCGSPEVAWFIRERAWCAECADERFEISEQTK